MRPKTKRRLSILLIAIVLAVGGAALLVYLSNARKDREAYAAREQGMAAFTQGDYDTALKQLSIFTTRVKTDPDAIYAQAVARSMVVEPKKQHLNTAINWLKAYDDLRPNDLRGKHKLLELYGQLNRNQEMLGTADDILKIDPNDLQALDTKATVLSGVRKYKEALVYAEKYNEVAPLDLDGQRLTYWLYKQLKRPGDEVVARAKADLSRFPDDPRMELMLAIAYNYAGDDSSARKMLMTAVKRKTPDAQFVRRAVLLLDDERDFDISREMLDRAAADLKSPDVLQLLVQRLWQDGEIAEMGKRLAAVDAKDPKAHTNLLAMKAISLYDAGDAAGAKAVLDTLAKRATDDEAYAWSNAINAYYGGRSDPKEAISALQSAANRDRDNAVIYLWTGDAYEQLGEVAHAVAAWKTAAQMSPAWATPHVRIAKLLAVSGRAEDAFHAAEQANQRAPKAMETRVAGVLALSAKLADDSRALSGGSLLRLVDEIQHDAPNEPQTLPMYVTLLARSGQPDKARGVIKDAIAPTAKVPVPTLLKIADVSIKLKLGMEQEVFDAAGRGGMTPDLALAIAEYQRSQGKNEESMKFLNDATAKATSDPAAWQMVNAQFYENMAAHPNVGGWKMVVEKYPADLRVQSAFLASNLRDMDRPLWSATVDRLKAITRDEGVRWRLERARYLLNGDPTDKDRAAAFALVNEVLGISPDLAEARLQLAAIHRMNGNRAGAVEQLRKAVDLQPGNAEATFTLAQLLHEQGQAVDSQAYLLRLVNSGTLSSQETRLAAQMLADQGQPSRAITALRSIKDPDIYAQTLQARLCRADGRNQEAGELYARIATTRPITSDAIASAADYYFDQKQPDKANAVLARLDELKGLVTASWPDVIRGQLAEKYDTPAAAQQYFVAAVQKSNDVVANRELAGFYLRQGDFTNARTAALAGLAAQKNNAELAALSRAIDGLSKLTPEQAKTAAAVLSRNPTDAGSLELIKAMGHAVLDRRIDALKAAAEKFPGSWPILEQLTLAYQSAGQIDKARDAALQAMNAAPRDPAPARLLYEICSEAEEWGAARSAAEQWRMRVPADARAADIAAATAAVEIDRNEDAVKILTPYLEAARTDVRGSTDVLWPYCRALLRQSKPAEVTALLGDLAKTDESVRGLWLGLAGDVRPSAIAATAWINQVSDKVGTSNAEQSALGWAWFAVGQKYEDSASFTKAAAIFRKLVAAGENTAANWILIGDSLRGSADLPGAEEAYRKAIAAGDSGHSCNALAFLLLQQEKQLDEAVQLAGRAITASPRNGSYYDTRGQIYLKLNKPQAAIDDFEKALSTDGESIESLVGKADGLVKLTKLEQARAVLQQADAILAQKPLISRYTRLQLAGVRKALEK